MAYFDNAATTYPKPLCVYDGMDSFNRSLAMNVNRGKYEESLKANQIVQETRKMIATLLNSESTHNVIFTPSATISLNMILQGISYKSVKNIYISPFEHNAVLRPLNYMREKFDFNIVELAVDKKNHKYDLEAINFQFQELKPDIVIVTHVSNVCGLIAPIKEIFDVAKKYDALTISDMSQSCGLINVDLKIVQADFVVFAGHKTLYASFGVGGFLIRKGVQLSPVIYGGTGVMSANPKQPETLPEKFEVGSLNTLAISSLYYSLIWLQNIGVNKIFEKEKENSQKLFNLLSKYANIKVYGNRQNCTGIVSCIFDDLSPDNAGDVLSRQNIAVRAGLHCAPNAHRFLGTFPAGTVRFSVSYFTSDKDFDELAKALDYIQYNS